MDKPNVDANVDPGQEEPEVEAEQVRQAHTLAVYGIMATVLNALIVFFIMNRILPSRALIAWLGAMLLVTAVKIMLLARFRFVSRVQFPARRWRRLFLAGLVAVGTVWGALGLFPFAGASPAHQVFIAFVLGGMAAGAASSFSVLKGGYEAYAVPALLPLTLRFFLMNDSFHFAMGSMLTLYGILLWRIARYHYKESRISLVLRFENRGMIESLKKAKENLERMYGSLRAEVDARLRAESELKKHQEYLERAVEERTADLTRVNMQLKNHIEERRHAAHERERLIAELERSNRELQHFAYVASHDLQEPLRTVSSFVELLALKYRGKIDAAADKYISFAVEGTNRMSSLISDLLIYSRVATRGHEFETVNMKETANQVVLSLRRFIRENDAVVTIDELPEVSGDRTQLVQLLQNLITNGIKFRKKDVAPRLRVSVETRSDHWIFSVRDNGIGIEQRFHDRIFVIFQRLHTREEYPGTGVGLAICKRIVERHGGRMWVESKEGEGSVFYFSLPQKEAVQRAA